MGYHRISIGFVAAALLALPFQELRADTAPKVVEEVDFAISCGPTSQQAFKHAVWTLHSFWYPEALAEFTAIAASEPGCAMAYWGIAMSHWYPLWYPPGPAALKAGQRLAAAGILAHVRGDDEKAVELVRAAADLDATMDKHPATPSSVLPARELLADLLLELNQPAAALVEYRAMLSTDPNRFRSLLGEARAAKQTSDSVTAHDAYGKLMALSKPVGPARPELAEAKSYLTN
jgi:hypothetical protein